MKGQRRIIVLDRSVLAGNLYRLLFSSLEASLVVRRRFEEMRPLLVGRERIDMAILNSNAFGKKAGEIVDSMSADGALKRIKKVFLLKEGDSEGDLRERIESLPEASVMTRPFHPDEFVQAVKGMLGEGR